MENRNNKNVVEIGQVRQKVKGPAWEGTMPFTVVAKDSVLKETWIVQNIIGGVFRMTTADVLDCGIFEK